MNLWDSLTQKVNQMLEHLDDSPPEHYEALPTEDPLIEENGIELDEFPPSQPKEDPPEVEPTPTSDLTLEEQIQFWKARQTPQTNPLLLFASFTTEILGKTWFDHPTKLLEALHLGPSNLRFPAICLEIRRELLHHRLWNQSLEELRHQELSTSGPHYLNQVHDVIYQLQRQNYSGFQDLITDLILLMDPPIF